MAKYILEFDERRLHEKIGSVQYEKLMDLYFPDDDGDIMDSIIVKDDSMSLEDAQKELVRRQEIDKQFGINSPNLHRIKEVPVLSPFKDGERNAMERQAERLRELVASTERAEKLCDEKEHFLFTLSGVYLGTSGEIITSEGLDRALKLIHAERDKISGYRFCLKSALEYTVKCIYNGGYMIYEDGTHDTGDIDMEAVREAAQYAAAINEIGALRGPIC